MYPRERVKLKFREICEQIREIPDLQLHCDGENCCGDILLEKHMPLQKACVKLCARKYFWSTNYDLLWSTDTGFEHSDFSIELSKDNRFKLISGTGAEVCAEALNENQLLSERINTLDIISFKINCIDKKLSVVLSVFSGSVTSMLIPPLTYRVPISSEEIVHILELLQLSEAVLKSI